MKIEYLSNNSGGGWWLSDDDWCALESAGWYVEWGGTWFCHSRWANPLDRERTPTCPDDGSCRGHRRAEKAEDAEPFRWLGCLARSAWIEAESEEAAIAMWREATSQDPDDEGCPCCGRPHNFWEKR